MISNRNVYLREVRLSLAERYGFHFCDALVVASALAAGCETLYTEDLQDGQVIDDRLTIRNPFKPPTVAN